MPARGAKMYAELEGWGFTCDAHSMVKSRLHRARATTGRPAGTLNRPLVPRRSGLRERLRPRHHGIGCDRNTDGEAGLGRPCLSSARQFVQSGTGHAFAASGAFQLIGTAEAMEHQFIPPTLNLTTPDPNCDLDYVSGTGRVTHVNRALINSFGFGGKNIVLALSRVNLGAAGTGSMKAAPAYGMNQLVGYLG